MDRSIGIGAGDGHFRKDETMAERIVVTGRVQGVFYRAFAKEAADALGVRGWVRNREDGAVELLADGDVDTLVERLRAGPVAAKVEEVRRENVVESPQDGFEIRR